MNPKQLNCEKRIEEIDAETAELINSLGFTPKLAVILASDDEPSSRYVKMKMKKAKSLGIDTELFEFNDKNPESIVAKITELNTDSTVTGILLQLPLFSELETERKKIIESIAPEKDVDGLTSSNLGKSTMFMMDGFIPATVEAILEAIDVSRVFDRGFSWSELVGSRRGVVLQKINALIVNNSNLIGKPLANILSNLGATVTIANEWTENLKERMQDADLVVSATGQGHIFDSEWTKEGALVVDVTSVKSNVVTSVGQTPASDLRNNNKVIGDFIQDEKLMEKVAAITPVPGGIGPLTVSCLLRNVGRAPANK